jgi:hypothetical protein
VKEEFNNKMRDQSTERRQITAWDLLLIIIITRATKIAIIDCPEINHKIIKWGINKTLISKLQIKVLEIFMIMSLTVMEDLVKTILQMMSKENLNTEEEVQLLKRNQPLEV